MPQDVTPREALPDPEIGLGKRAMEYLSDYENAVLRYLANEVNKLIQPGDLVFYIGNSGRYVLL